MSSSRDRCARSSRCSCAVSTDQIFPWPLLPTLLKFLTVPLLSHRPALHARDNLLGNRVRRLFVSQEMHRVRGPALSPRPQVRGIAEHLRQRYLGTNDLSGATLLHAFDMAATACQVAENITHKLFRHHYLDLHHRLEEHRAGPFRGILEADRSGDLEGHLGRVYFMIRTIKKPHAQSRHLVTRQDARFHRLANTLVRRPNILPRHGPSR